MVRVDDDLENMPPAERLKLLRARAEQRRKELEELERKKKEEELRELAELEETIRDLQEEEEQKFREEEEKKRKQQRASLEETVEEESTATTPIQASNESYSTQPLTPPGPNTTFYDLTNYNLYNKVKELAEKADTNTITAEERNFLSGVSYQMERIQREEKYSSSQDPKNYISRTTGLLKELEDKWNM